VWPRTREAAETARAAIRSGGDPAEDRQTAKAAPTDTVAALVAEYIAKHVRVKQRARVEEERIVSVEILRGGTIDRCAASLDATSAR
jgi:hypothetical protein